MGKHTLKTPDQIAAEKLAETKTPAYQENIGLNGTFIDFIQADYAIKAEALNTQAVARSQIKEKFYAITMRTINKNAALEKQIEEAAITASQLRDALHKGAREAFLAGSHQKIQAMFFEPEKFLEVGVKYSSETTDSFVAKNLIELMRASENPAAVPALALKDVAGGLKKNYLDYTLYKLISAKTFDEKIAFALLKAGAKATGGLVLAEAVHKNASLPLVAQLVKSGAKFDVAAEIMSKDSKRYGNSAERLIFVQDKLALQKQNKALQKKNEALKAQLAALQENAQDVTASRGRHTAPAVVPTAPRPAL